MPARPENVSRLPPMASPSFDISLTARAMSAEALAARWRERAAAPAQVIAEPDALAAVERARQQPGPTVVAGSLYLVGAVRSHLVDDPELRDPPLA